MNNIIRTCLLGALLISLIGCAPEPPEEDTDPIDMEVWCDQDAELPWSGCWREIYQINCETGDEFESDDPIGELRLTSDGSYSITWQPFEYYLDYAGTYNIDVAQGKITFSDTGASGFDGDGSYIINENGELELIDIWFGIFYPGYESEGEIASCGYVFR